MTGVNVALVDMLSIKPVVLPNRVLSWVCTFPDHLRTNKLIRRFSK